MAACTTCKWHRSQASPVVILRSLIGSAHPEVQSKLDQIESKENGKLDAEEQEVELKENRARYLLAQVGGDFDHMQVPADLSDEQFQRTVAAFPIFFEGEPGCSPHCVAPASPDKISAAKKWSIPSLRNWAGLCSSYSRQVQPTSCKDCVHYQAAQGDSEDERELKDLTGMLGRAHGQAAQLITDRITKRLATIGPHKAYELEQAYNGHGSVAQPLRYFPYCIKHSAVPELWNRFFTCRDFRSTRQTTTFTASRKDQEGEKGNPVQPPAPQVGSTAPPTQKSTPADSTELELAPMPEQPLKSEGVTELAAIGLSPFGPGRRRQQRYEMSPEFGNVVHSTLRGAVALVRNMANVLEGQPASFPADTSPVIVRGNPPLTVEMLRQSTRAATIAYGRALSTEEQERYAAFVKAAWTRGVRPAIEVQLALMAGARSLTQGQAVRHMRQFMDACGATPGVNQHRQP